MDSRPLLVVLLLANLSSSGDLIGAAWLAVGETTVPDHFLYLLADLSTFVWILLGRLDRPVRETVLVSCVCSCVRGVLLGVLRVPHILACVRPHPPSIREDRATLVVPYYIRTWIVLIV